MIFIYFWTSLDKLKKMFFQNFSGQNRRHNFNVSWAAKFIPKYFLSESDKNWRFYLKKKWPLPQKKRPFFLGGSNFICHLSQICLKAGFKQYIFRLRKSVQDKSRACFFILHIFSTIIVDPLVLIKIVPFWKRKV